MEIDKFLVRMVAWILTSFLCHHAGKTFMQNTKQVIYSNEISSIPCMALAPPLLLTLLQCLACLILASFTWNDGSVRLVMISHLLATLATNTSMASLHTASTFTMKLSEPVIMAIACRWRSKTSVPATSLLGLLLIVTGALFFIGNPIKSTSTIIGVITAVTSSLLITFRNLQLKDVLHRAGQTQLVDARGVSCLTTPITLAGVTLLAALWLIFVTTSQTTGIGSHLITWNNGIASGIFHAVYTGISTMVILKTVDTFSHSIAGVFKRIATVLMLHIFGQHQATTTNFNGLAVTVLGLLFHISPHKGKRALLLGILCLAVVTCVEYCSFPSTRYVHTPQRIVRNQFFNQRLYLKSLLSASKSSEKLSFMNNTLTVISQSRKSAGYEPPFSEKNNTIMQFHSLRSVNTHYQDSLDNTHAENTEMENKLETVEKSSMPSHRLTLKPFIYSPLPVVDRKLDNLNAFGHEVIFDNLESMDTQSDSQNDIEDAHRQMANFLKSNLVNNPFRTNSLSRLLKNSKNIVQEARRVLENILKDLIGYARYAMLMEVATFENKGDPAISIGELLQLKTLNLSLIFHCSTFTCTDRNLDEAVKLSAHYDTNDIIVFMQGGGNLVLYKSSEDIREKVLRRFSHFKMILLSQSLWIPLKLNSRLKRCQRMYSHHPNLTIFLRDEQSLHLAQNHFPGTDVFLAPDMAFYIGSCPRSFPPTFDIVWLRRHDQESTKYSLPEWNSSLRIHVDDWVNWKTQKGINDLDTAALMTQNGLTFLQRGKVIITDRLHGHILSLLLDIPHVIIDNPPAKKLSSYHHTWTASASRVTLVTSPEDALTEAIKMLERYSSTLPTRLPYVGES